MYCEKCKHLFEGDRCPNCRKSHVRPVQPEDPCFLVEKGAPWNGMLEDVLRQNDIPFLTDNWKRSTFSVRCLSIREM